MKMEERRMAFSTCVLKEWQMYAFTNYGGIPVKIDLRNEELSYITDLKNYQLFNADQMLYTENGVLALELNGKRMLCYDEKKKECVYYNIECDKTKWDNYAAFVAYKEEVFIFPTYADAIVKINLRSGRMQEDGKLYAEIDEYNPQKEQQDCPHFYCGCQIDRILWLFQKKGSLAVAYDLETGTWKKYRLSVQMDSCVHVVHYAGKLYMLSSEGKIYCWGMTEEPLELVADCGGMDADDSAFARIAVTDKRIFLLPSLGEDIFSINLNTKQVEKYESYPDGFAYCYPKEMSKYRGYCEDEENYYFAMRSTNFMLCFNKRTGKEKWLKLKLPAYEEYVRMYMKYNKSLLNEREYRIEHVLDYSEDNFTEGRGEEHTSLGKQIWGQVKKG